MLFSPGVDLLPMSKHQQPWRQRIANVWHFYLLWKEAWKDFLNSFRKNSRHRGCNEPSKTTNETVSQVTKLYRKPRRRQNWKLNVLLQESDKGQTFYWSIQTCSSIMQLFDRLIDRLWPCSKNLKTALFQTFSTWHPNTFCPYCFILTQYHQVPTSTVLYWPSTIVHQTLPTYTDPLPPSTNK